MDKKPRIDFTELAALVKGCRTTKGLTLRDAALQSGVSASTLSRIERAQAQPDLDTVKALVDWAGASLDKVISGPQLWPPETIKKTPKKSPQKTDNDTSTIVAVETHFRADPNLSPKAAEALITIMRAAYSQMVHNKDNQ